MKMSHEMISNDLSMGLIENHDLERFWPGVSEMLDKLPHTWGHFTKEEIQAGVFGGGLQLWGVGPHGVAIFMLLTTVAFYPSKKALVLTWGAGTFRKSMIPLLDATLTNYGRAQGCDLIEVHGREGWARMLSGIGFKQDKIVLSRKIEKERMH